MNKGATVESVLRGLRASGLYPVLLSELSASTAASGIVVVAVVHQDPRRPAWHDLTARERDVARLVAKALTNQQIATRLGITTHTVNFHLRHIFRKLSISSRVSLAAYAGNPE